MIKKVGNLWNDKNIEIYEIYGKMYALYGWNGEKYLHCWEVLDKDGLQGLVDTEYIIIPIYNECEVVDFEVS